MTLTPVPVHFAKADSVPEFNERAAQAAYDAVMKMDTEEARLFTTAVVVDVVLETIEKNHRTLQGRLNRVVAKRIDDAKKAVERGVLAKRMGDEDFDEEGVLALAGSLALIEKATKTPYDYGYVWNENDFKRGSDGRFQTKVDVNAGRNKRALHGKERESAGVPKAYHQGAERNQGRHLTEEARADFQQQYLQVASALSRFGDNDDMRLQVRTGRGTVEERRLSGKKRKDIDGMWDPHEEDVVGVSVGPKDLTIGGSTFMLGSALGMSAQEAARVGGQAQAAGDNAGRFADTWDQASAKGQYNSNERLYGRLKSGSDFVGSVAPSGSKAQMAASFGSYVGEHGPQAERVFGPATRRAAYRYRGVTKEPESGLKNEYEAKVKGDKRLTGDQTKAIESAQAKAIISARKAKAKAEKKPLVQAVLSDQEMTTIRSKVRSDMLGRAKSNTVTDEVKSEGRQTLARRLMARAPKGSLYNLQLKSGHTPPSEGVLIDARGNVVAQAVGYGDDHYLPFNLKQLGALRGGEYVRTRSAGGPTTEDIYTGLLAGASAVTVASRSGTFVVEFEDDFKGSRRYNDKAKRMIDRYGKLLDAVQSGQVEKPINTADAERLIRTKVNNDPEFRFATDDEREKAFVERFRAYRADPGWNEVDSQRVTEAFVRDNPEYNTEGGRNFVAKDVRARIKEEKELNYQLNGRGYEAALEALQEQFPYYIKSVRRVKRDNDAISAGTRDRGYVKPRFNRPAEAKASYYDKTITGRSKVGADQTDYQNNRVGNQGYQENLGQRTERREQEATARQESGSSDVKVPKTQPAQDDKAKKLAQADLSDVASTIASEIRRINDAAPDSGVTAVLSRVGTPDELRDEVGRMGQSSPRFQALNGLIEANEVELFGGTGDDGKQVSGQIADGEKLLTRLNTARDGGTTFSRANLFHSGKNPQRFDEYEGLKADQLTEEMRRRDGKDITGQMNLSDLTEAGLREQVEELGELRKVVEAARALREGESNDNDGRALYNQHLERNLKRLGQVDDAMVRLAGSNPKRFDDHVENVQRMRSLKALSSKAGSATPKQQAQGDETTAQQNGKQAAADAGSTADAVERAYGQAVQTVERARRAGNAEAESDARDAMVELNRLRNDTRGPAAADALNEVSKPLMRAMYLLDKDEA